MRLLQAETDVKKGGDRLQAGFFLQDTSLIPADILPGACMQTKQLRRTLQQQDGSPVSHLSFAAACLQRQQASKVLQQFQEIPDAWTKVDTIMEQSSSQQTKFLALGVCVALLPALNGVHSIMALHMPGSIPQPAE